MALDLERETESFRLATTDHNMRTRVKRQTCSTRPVLVLCSQGTIMNFATGFHHQQHYRYSGDQLRILSTNVETHRRSHSDRDGHGPSVETMCVEVEKSTQKIRHGLALTRRRGVSVILFATPCTRRRTPGKSGDDSSSLKTRESHQHPAERIGEPLDCAVNTWRNVRRWAGGGQTGANRGERLAGGFIPLRRAQSLTNTKKSATRSSQSSNDVGSLVNCVYKHVDYGSCIAMFLRLCGQCMRTATRIVNPLGIRLL
jgi:hypothetical protein